MNPPPPPDYFDFPPLPPYHYESSIPPWDPPPPPPDSNGGWIIVLLIVAFVASLLACLVKGYCNSRALAESDAEAAARAASAAQVLEWLSLTRLESHRLPRRRGTNPAARLPSFKYNRSLKHNVTAGGEEAAATCSVCLGVFQLGETVRLLPACLHLYHAECIDPWLDAHSTCPICRSDAHPTTDGARARLPPV